MQNCSLIPEWCRLQPQGGSACATAMGAQKELNGPTQPHLWLPPTPCPRPILSSALGLQSQLELCWKRAGFQHSWVWLPQLQTCSRPADWLRSVSSDLLAHQGLVWWSELWAHPGHALWVSLRYCGVGAGETRVLPALLSPSSPSCMEQPALALPWHLLGRYLYPCMAWFCFTSVNDSCLSFFPMVIHGWPSLLPPLWRDRNYIFYTTFGTKSQLFSAQSASWGCSWSTSLGIKRTSNVICFLSPSLRWWT